MKTKIVSENQQGAEALRRTKINDHPMVAGLAFLGGLLPTYVYHEAFGQHGFNASDLPWKLALAIQLFIPALLITHYLINRRRCRLWWEGIVALANVVGLWMVLGSWPFFYFGFAPMPMWEKGAGLLLCLGGTIFWLVRVWCDYARYDREEKLEENLFLEEKNRIVYKNTEADSVVAHLPQRNPFTQIHYWLVSFFGPLLGGVFLLAIRMAPQASGPHMLFLLASFLSFPLSQRLLGYLGVRTAYFHVYLPLRLERRAGKMVILVP